MTKNVLVCGAGGFIGSHLVKDQLKRGHRVFAADIKPIYEWEQVHDGAYNEASTDLSLWENCRKVVDYIDEVYMLAADMGGMGYIETHRYECMLSTLISTHMVKASVEAGVGRYFYSSSACVYAADKQIDPDVTALKESDAYPAMAERGYGWEKLIAEQLATEARVEKGLETRIARFHNVYGMHTAWRGGREKAPAAICRKVAEAVLSGDHHIEIWGDGSATRSFMEVDDCVEGINKIMRSDFVDPINLGSSELVSVNELVSIVEGIAGVTLERHYDLSAPQGVRGRNSDNTLIRATLDGWEPSTPLQDGLTKLYAWVLKQVEASQR